MTAREEAGEEIIEAAARWLQAEIDREISLVDDGEADDVSDEYPSMLKAGVALAEVMLVLRGRKARQRGQRYDAVEEIFEALKAISLREAAAAKFDAQLLADGFAMAGMYLDKGDRSFTAYANTMILAMGTQIKPYLRSVYEAARHYPPFDSAGMTDEATCRREFDRILATEG